MITINIKNQVEESIPTNLQTEISKFLKQKLPQIKKEIVVNISLVNTNEIKSLNKKYRDIDKPTDVLSFPIYKSFRGINNTVVNTIELGDIFICPKYVQKHFTDYHISTKQDILTFLSLHGVKHLVGIHHK